MLLSQYSQPNLDELLNFDFRTRLGFEFSLTAINKKNSDSYVLTRNILEYVKNTEKMFQISKQSKLVHKYFYPRFLLSFMRAYNVWLLNCVFLKKLKYFIVFHEKKTMKNNLIKLRKTFF